MTAHRSPKQVPVHDVAQPDEAIGKRFSSLGCSPDAAAAAVTFSGIVGDAIDDVAFAEVQPATRHITSDVIGKPLTVMENETDFAV